jgi:DNA-directed RNA polymerase subunit RPC12/RpoP
MVYICQECEAEVDARDADVKVKGADIEIRFVCPSCGSDNEFCE